MFELHHLHTARRIRYQLGFIVRLINNIIIELFDDSLMTSYVKTLAISKQF